MKTATLIKDRLTDFTGHAALYKLSEPLKAFDWDGKLEGEYEYVVVSATSAWLGGSETYIFPSNKDGEVVDWRELKGSYRGGMSHETAINGAGYKLIAIESEHLKNI